MVVTETTRGQYSHSSKIGLFMLYVGFVQYTEKRPAVALAQTRDNPVLEVLLPSAGSCPVKTRPTAQNGG